MITDLLLITAGGEIDLRYSKPLHRLRARYIYETPTVVDSMLKHGFSLNTDREGEVRTLRYVGPYEEGSENHPLPSLTPYEVADHCAAANERAILVTCELALALQYAEQIAWKNLDKVIVITGAAMPTAMHDSDADINVGFGLAAAQLYPTPGVYIAFRGDIHIWNQCQRTDRGFMSFVRLAPASAFA